MDEDDECLAWINLRFQCLALASKDNAGFSTDDILKAAEAYVDFIFEGTVDKNETEKTSTERTN